jgi:hypothetical protein
MQGVPSKVLTGRRMFPPIAAGGGDRQYQPAGQKRIHGLCKTPRLAPDPGGQLLRGSRQEAADLPPLLQALTPKDENPSEIQGRAVATSSRNGGEIISERRAASRKRQMAVSTGPRKP